MKLEQLLKRAVSRTFVAALTTIGVSATSSAQPSPAAAAAQSTVLLRDVRVFDDRRAALSGPVDVLVRGNTIERIAATSIAPDPAVPATVIAGNGRTLMPGLIDNHWPTMLAATPPPLLLEGDLGYLNLLAAAQAEATLLRGFTTVRGLGGPAFALKRAIDEGLVAGPLDISTFDEDELRAAVRAAANWGTYVGTAVAVQRAVASGVKVI